MTLSSGRSTRFFLCVICVICVICGFLPGALAAAIGREKVLASPFKYVGGSDKLPEGCQGSLQVGADALNFICPAGTVSVPYTAISFMQYRPDVSRKVSKMKIKWQVKPPWTGPLMGGKKNRYFAIVYEEHGAPAALVLEVPPLTMRPYLAEIDLKAGKRVEVKEYEEYD